MRKITIWSFLLAFILSFSWYAFAQKPEEINLDLNLPEKPGLYEIKGRSDLKLRVFAHPEKPEKIEGQSFFKKDRNANSTSYVCGLGDPDSDLLVDRANWKLPNSWQVKINLSTVPSTVGINNFSEIVQNSFNAWLNAINNKVNIIYDKTTFTSKARFDGQNIIAFSSAPAGYLAVSYIWYNKDGYAVEVDTILNNKYRWYWSNDTNCAYQNGYDVQNILTHEIGHSFGLDDEYEDSYKDHTMYGYGAQGEVKKDTLTTGDKNSVFSLYSN
jgi:hypothetical protein